MHTRHGRASAFSERTSGECGPNQDFLVGEFLVKPSEGCIESPQSGCQHLEPKALEVLTCLARHRGRTVTKGVLFEEVWPNVAVTEYVLTRTIAQIRKAFGDNARKQAVIQTVYKRGYRLQPPVSFRTETELPTEPAGLSDRDAVSMDLSSAAVYRQILAATQDHIYLFDRQGRCVFANQAGARALGLEPKAMLGRSWRRLKLFSEMLELVEHQLALSFSRGHEIREQLRYPTIYGELLYEYSFDPVRDAQGAVVSVLAIVRDITSRCQNCVFSKRQPQ